MSNRKDYKDVAPYDLIVQLATEVKQLKARVSDLEAVALEVRDDLILRAELDFDGISVVNLSSSKWVRLCDVINAGEALWTTN